jgi:urease accessory protein
VIVGPARVARSIRLLQFGDSALPVGSFSFSNGLEPAVHRGVVVDVRTLREFVGTATHQAASSDGIALLHAHRAAGRGDLTGIVRADHALHERKVNEEMRAMTVRMGRKLAELAARVVGTPYLRGWREAIAAGTAPGTYPVGLGVLFAELSSPEEDAFAVHQYGVAMMILSAALRLMRVDHLDTQSILFDVDAGATGEYAVAASATLADMATFAPVTDVLAAAHVRSHVRLFQS